MRCSIMPGLPRVLPGAPQRPDACMIGQHSSKSQAQSGCARRALGSAAACRHSCACHGSSGKRSRAASCRLGVVTHHRMCQLPLPLVYIEFLDAGALNGQIHIPQCQGVTVREAAPPANRRATCQGGAMGIFRTGKKNGKRKPMPKVLLLMQEPRIL